MTNNKAGYTEGIVSIVINLALFALKIWAGIVSGSIALTADAWHTLSDSMSSMVVVVATKLSSKKPDREHPFGHGRWEQIAALFIAFLLAIVAWDFLTNSIERFNEKETVDFGILAIVVTLVSIAVKEALAQYAFYLARKTSNISIKADGWHHRTDALSSVVVLVGILFARHFYWIDSVLGLAISLMLFYAAWTIVREAVVKLLGEEPSAELIEQIAGSVRAAYSQDLHLHHFHIHNYVTHQELTLHIKLDKNLSIEVGHRIATEIENIIKVNFGIVATVHVEPLDFYHRTD
ncbi:MAG: cation diffusion facilitator family transporter [Prevotellaceae bacterium]|jgi:cation diffusion facilitator family transporter|nr:cation diffusion facilitator family transporter [Prevotellaceae bacterium]